MMRPKSCNRKELLIKLKNLQETDISEKENIDQYINQIEKENSEQDIETFWPPRLLEAYKANKMLCFFGAGLSIPSGLPTWTELLDRLSVDQRYLEDRALRNDPLTLAELAYHQLGAERLQIVLRKSVEGHNPSLSHIFTAILKLPFYITSNYDTLFEDSWAIINDDEPLITLLDNDDVLREFPNGFDIEALQKSNKHYLLKIHGCVKEMDKLLILTRSEYRKHYRTNDLFFDFLKELMGKYHTLFIGFSHQDPEVTRLVEDVIFIYESDKISITKPNFYSLQFDMRKHTPEIFAAKGIVALKPPFSYRDDKSHSLRTALIDIIISSDITNLKKYHKLYEILLKFRDKLTEELENALNIMVTNKSKIVEKNEKGGDIKEDMQQLYNNIGELANQGVYFCNADGTVLEYFEPEHLSGKVRKGITNFGIRPYFKQAKTFKKPFISDSYSSIYNANSTIFLCEPIIKKGSFDGLLFSAAQIGHWELPIDLAKEAWNTGLNILLVDSNGVCLLPPNNEIAAAVHDNSFGYFYNDLLAISRRDRLVKRIMENIVPLDEDDDIYT
ncbi:MAG: hypothetical protein GF364_07435, partial [Candidatus Lokiarchaeota archaeon]|nr:hypothetical protein [Candidatus Lokiarchaeota archaeon]